jgi:hypothetical protein
MDDLDRLYVALVEVLRRERPAALTQPLTVLELHDRLIPYRRVRNAAELRSNDDYETALSRLLAGERGYLQGDPAMQEELKAGLAEALPDIRRYRAFPDMRVSLDAELVPPPGHIRYAPPEVRERLEWLEGAAAPHDPVASPGATREPEGPAPMRDEAAGGGAPSEAAPAGVCAACGAEAPAAASFCPFCGARLTPGICRSCGANLERAWRFCAECGVPRDVKRGGPA